MARLQKITPKTEPPKTEPKSPKTEVVSIFKIKKFKLVEDVIETMYIFFYR